MGEGNKKVTRLRFCLVGLAMLFALAARADLVMVQESSDTNTFLTATIRVHDQQMRMDQQDTNGNTFSVIVNLTTRDSFTLIPKEKKFMKRSGAVIRKQMEDEMKISGGTNELDHAPARAMDTGRRETVAGYETKIYTWTGARGLTETLWVAENFPNYAALREDFARIDQFNESGPHRNAQPTMALLPGMVVKRVSAIKGREITMKLLSAKSEPVPATFFAVPPDYSLWKPQISANGNNPATPAK